MSDEKKVAKKERLKSTLIYQVIMNDGRQELARPASSLWFSGLAAGVSLPTSVLTEALLYNHLPDAEWRPAVESFGYCFGFVLVVMGRLQLFTEQTITAVLPLFSNFGLRQFLRTLRLWSIVLGANLVGTFAIAWIALEGGVISPEIADGMLHVSSGFAALSGSEAFLYGIPAGFFIAAIVWMMPNAEGNQIWIVIAFTYLIALGGFSHAIVGSFEVFMLVFAGDLEMIDGTLRLILPTIAGNIIGGTGLFALLAYGQVAEEL